MEDNATFTCKANAIPFTELASVNASDVGEGSVNVIVQSRFILFIKLVLLIFLFFFSSIGPSPPSVNILRSSDFVIAGESFNMTCLVQVPHELLRGPVVRWSGPGINQNISLLDNSPHTLIFDRIHTSHAGVYKCIATFSIPEAGINFTGMGMTVVNIQST